MKKKNHKILEKLRSHVRYGDAVGSLYNGHTSLAHGIVFNSYFFCFRAERWNHNFWFWTEMERVAEWVWLVLLFASKRNEIKNCWFCCDVQVMLVPCAPIVCSFFEILFNFLGFSFRYVFQRHIHKHKRTTQQKNWSTFHWCDRTIYIFWLEPSIEYNMNEYCLHDLVGCYHIFGWSQSIVHCSRSCSLYSSCFYDATITTCIVHSIIIFSIAMGWSCISISVENLTKLRMISLGISFLMNFGFLSFATGGTKWKIDGRCCCAPSDERRLIWHHKTVIYCWQLPIFSLFLGL